MIYKQHTTCRVCNNDKLIPYLVLGMLPLSNNLAISTTDSIHNERYPLQLLLCEKCGLSQLSIVIPPEILFSHYVYRSSISEGYISHCLQMAVDLKEKHNLTPDSFHIDIAGNDGCLLNQFKKFIGHKILNVDPALNLAGICEAADIPVLSFFWGMDVARKIINGGLGKFSSGSKSKEDTGSGKADLITATNVFAHCEDVEDFMKAVKYVLKPTGVLVLEMPYLIDFINKREFDTIYHEHLSYFSVYPITLLCERIGLTVMRVEKKEIHGGTIRVTIGFGKQDESVYQFVSDERENYTDIEKYYEFAEDVQITINNFRDGLNKLKSSGSKICGFAASAKGCVLLNCAGVTVGTMNYIVDQTAEKIGKYQPGTRIPIVTIDDMMRNPPDYLVVLSWNFLSEIIEKTRKVGYIGKYIVGIPDFKIID